MLLNRKILVSIFLEVGGVLIVIWLCYRWGRGFVGVVGLFDCCYLVVFWIYCYSNLYS